MGKSHSKTVSNITTNIINTDDITDINKSVVNSAVNVLIKNASTCKSAVHQSNSCKYNHITGGDVNLNANQKNEAKVNFSCIQASSAASQMATAMKQSLQGQLEAISGTEAAAALNAMAESANKSGFGNTGGGSKADTNTKMETNITNETKTLIENIYEQNLTNNFNAETVNECIGKTTQENEYLAEYVEGEKVTGNCNQSNTLEQVQECKQLSEAANKVLQETAQELGFKVIIENNTVVKDESAAGSGSKNESTGPIQDLGNAIGGIFGNLASLFGLASLGAVGSFAVSFCCCCCCILIILLVIYMAGNSGNSGNSGNTPRTKYQRGGSDTFDYLTSLSISMVSDIISD
jgi:hypothetical protein